MASVEQQSNSLPAFLHPASFRPGLSGPSPAGFEAGLSQSNLLAGAGYNSSDGSAETGQALRPGQHLGSSVACHGERRAAANGGDVDGGQSADDGSVAQAQSMAKGRPKGRPAQPVVLDAPEPKSDVTVPCPRCNSVRTKFSYFNNNNVKQPRYYCKDCERHWTLGGCIRPNVPVGAGSRKRRKPSPEPNLGADHSAPACHGGMAEHQAAVTAQPGSLQVPLIALASSHVREHRVLAAQAICNSLFVMISDGGFHSGLPPAAALVGLPWADLSHTLATQFPAMPQVLPQVAFAQQAGGPMPCATTTAAACLGLAEQQQVAGSAATSMASFLMPSPVAALHSAAADGQQQCGSLLGSSLQAGQHEAAPSAATSAAQGPMAALSQDAARGFARSEPQQQQLLLSAMPQFAPPQQQVAALLQNTYCAMMQQQLQQQQVPGMWGSWVGPGLLPPMATGMAFLPQTGAVAASPTADDMADELLHVNGNNH